MPPKIKKSSPSHIVCDFPKKEENESGFSSPLPDPWVFLVTQGIHCLKVPGCTVQLEQFYNVNSIVFSTSASPNLPQYLLISSMMTVFASPFLFLSF
jgi:hypothetical protein